MVFSLHNVAHYYVRPESDAVDAPVCGIHVDRLDIAKTGLTAVIGPSGSGKTTLLSILAGFIPAETGQGGYLRFGDEAMGADGHPAGRVAFVFQSPMLLGEASGLVNVLQGQVAAGSRPDHDPPTTGEMRRMLGELGLLYDGRGKTLIAKRARYLSGGEAQRVAILRALFTDPDAILCDEPTSSLDEANAHRALSTLSHWASERQRPVVWVTHNLEQAAHYADHFVFISGGRIVTPEPEVAARLEQAEGAERTELLRTIARSLKDGRAEASGAPGAPPAGDDVPIRVGRVRYASWIANALSTADGFAQKKAGEAALAPAGLLRLLTRVVPAFHVRLGSLGRALGRVASYSRYELALIFFVLLFQVTAADFLRRVAEAYSLERLQDPSVARIVFEHAVLARVADVEPVDLYAASTVEALRGAIAAGLAQALDDLDQQRVQVFGRRSVAQSELSFPTAGENCRDLWAPVETVALDADDPLVLQTRLTEGGGAMIGSIEAAAAQAREARDTGSGPRIALLQSDLLDYVRDRCGFEAGTPIVADWAAGQGGRPRPIRLEIAGAIAESPPLYPNSADLIVFEHDYQVAVNLQDGRLPDPFRIATAYFPIDGFDVTRRVIAERGYRIRDDSAAAVETLRRVATIADIVPWVIIALNAAAAILIVNRIVDSLFELNKRVLALFFAHGFRLWDILLVLGLHLLPAFLLSLAILAALASWPWGDGLFPEDIGSIPSMRVQALLWSAAGATVVAAGALSYSTVRWWMRIRRSFKDILQD